MKRKRFSPAVRASILERQGGVCAHCGEPGERWEYDHVIPLALGGEDAPENIEAVHMLCHRQKTKGDVTRIAKAKRIERKRINAPKPSALKSRGFRTWRGLDGTMRFKDE